MSLDVDMEKFNYSGADNDPAAVGQQVVDSNSYKQEAGEWPSHPELMEPEVKSSVDSSDNEPVINPQAEHFRALREEVDRIKAERETDRKEHQLQLDMLRANVSRQAQQRDSEPQPKQMLDEMRSEDVLNVGELRQLKAEMQRDFNQKQEAYRAQLEELQVQQMHSDYAEVIEKYALPLVKLKPHLAEGIQGASNKALYAYELGKMAQQAQQQQAPAPQQKSQNAQRIIENSKKPGTLSQAGGQAALSQADYYATMSDKEFMQMAGRHLDSI